MSRYTLDVLPAIPHVTAVHARVVTHWFAEGGDWRIDALAPNQRDRLLTSAAASATSRGRRRITAFDRVLINQLFRDGRASHRAVAAELTTSSSSVKRRLDELVRLRLLSFRCDFARPLGGWPVSVTFAATAPPNALPEIGYALIRLPQTRNCAAVSGAHNLVLQASLHSVAEVARFEHRLATTYPELSITERAITLRHDKLLGRILDPHGRSRAVVPPDVWAQPRHTG